MDYTDINQHKTMALNGNEIIVYAYVNSTWTAIAATKSDEFDVSADTIEVASSTTGEWRDYIAGRKEWSLNVSWLVSVVADIRKVLNVGTKYQLRIGARTYAAASGLTGYAILESCKITATRGNLVQGSFSFNGAGALAADSTT